MEQIFQEVIINGEIERILEMFRSTVECVPRGICLPDEAKIVVSKYYVSFIDDGEVKLVNGGASSFVEVRAGSYLLLTNSWNMFALKHMDKLIAYGPRVAVGKEVYTADELIEFVRRGFKAILSKAILSAANWV
jgi:hypothetical protein